MGTAYEQNQSVASDLKWRKFITDAKLQQVVSMALTNNRDLRLAAQNVERARAYYGIQRDALYPTINASADASKQQTAAGLTQPGQPRTTERYDINLGVAAWEIDFFGRIRNLKDRALEEYLAAEQTRRSAQILLVSSVSQAYLTLATDRENLALAKTTLASQQASYALVKRRFDLDLATELDVSRAQTQVDAARGDVARFIQLVALDENALNLLAGSPVPRELLPADLAGVNAPEEISAGLSSEVLLRRPDVLQAENMLKAAHADIGAARAAFFPRISLTAAIGVASSDLSGLFKAGAGTWSYAPQLVMPIFDARTWSANEAAKVQLKMAVTQYEKTIQTAFREVADTLAVRGTVNQQIEAQQSLVNSIEKTYRLSSSRYDKGLDSYLSVLDAQRSLYAAQQGLVSLRLAQISSQVRLYSVLGGAWQDGH